jgi:hypothetical protein
MFQEPSTTHLTLLQSLVIKLTSKIETEDSKGHKKRSSILAISSCLVAFHPILGDFVARFGALEKAKS